MTDLGRTSIFGQVNETSDLVTADQAAQIIGRDRRTISRWAESGVLPTHIQLPGDKGARLFRRSDVEALADERRAS